MEKNAAIIGLLAGTALGYFYPKAEKYFKQKEPVSLFPKASLEPISNQLVRVSKAKDVAEILKESHKLIEMVESYGPPLSNSCELHFIQDAVNLNQYVATRYGPIFNTDPSMPKMEFQNPVPTNKLRGYGGSRAHIHYSEFLCDFGDLLKKYQDGLIKE